MQKTNKFFGGLALLALIGVGIYLNRGRQAATAGVAALSGQSANRPIVHVQRPAVSEDIEEQPDHDAPLKVSRGKVDEYLRLHNRNAASLLAAFHALKDTNYLYEAATNFPNDPRVQWTVLARGVFPEDRREWLDNFKASSPSNSLANYLSARDYFENNQPEAALKELSAASGKSQFKDYSMDAILDGEELGRFGGCSAANTRTGAMGGASEDLLPQLAALKGVAVNVRDLEQQYINAGDAASAQNLAEMGLGLTDRLFSGDGGKFLINQLVGMGAEAMVLSSLDQNTSCDFLGGETPAQRLAELKQERASIKELNKNFSNVYSTLSEDQMASFWERQKIYGEQEALRWLSQQNATTPSSGN